LENSKQYCRKVSFADERSANEYINKLKSTSERVNVPVRAYLCPRCFSWHLTSQKTKEVQIFESKVEELQKIIKDQKRIILDLNTQNKKKDLRIAALKKHISSIQKYQETLKVFEKADKR